MKSVGKFSMWLAVAALLSFAPRAFGQSKVNLKVASSQNSILNYAPAGFLALTLGPRGRVVDGNAGNGDRGGDNGCSTQGSGRGRDDRGWVGGGCTAVPEGGTALMYLLLAGLCCIGAFAFRSRRPVSVRDNG